MQFRPGVAKTSLLVEGARGFARIERDKAATAPMRFRDGGFQKRHSCTGPAGLFVDNEFFKSCIFASETNGRHVRRRDHAKNFATDFEDDDTAALARDEVTIDGTCRARS